MPPFLRIQDVADILIMTFLLYQLYSWFRRTRAMQVLLGLGVVTLIYFATRFLGLYMTSWILQELGTVLIVLVIVVFQAEIRQALYRFSLLRHLFEESGAGHEHRFSDLAASVFAMAAQRTGAILVLQRNESLADLVLNGVRLDCEVSPQILESIFADGTPLHDGAVLIRDGRIASASCHLPLSASPDFPQYYGTRHRAALGLSERTDAVVVTVSEERGDVMLFVGGGYRALSSPAELTTALEELVTPVQARPCMTLRQALFSNLLPKAALLALVTVFWALIMSRQGQITTVTAPVRLHGVPDGLVLVKNVPEEVDVQLKSLSSLAPAPSKLDLSADVDLSGAREGQASVRIKHSDFKLPSGMVVVSITPATVKVHMEKKMRKSVPVRVMLRGGLPRGLGSFEVQARPASVEVEGPAGQVTRLESVVTEEVDASRLAKGVVQRKNLQPPQGQVVLLRDEPVAVGLYPRRNPR